MLIIMQKQSKILANLPQVNERNTRDGGLKVPG